MRVNKYIQVRQKTCHYFFFGVLMGGANEFTGSTFYFGKLRRVPDDGVPNVDCLSAADGVLAPVVKL